MQFGDFYVMEELPHTETFFRKYYPIDSVPFPLPKGSLPVVLPGVTLTGAISWPFPKSDH